MKLRGIVSEDFINYKKPSLYLISAYCDWKCCTDANMDTAMCQNRDIFYQPEKDFSPSVILKNYLKNDITKAVVVGGLEPLLQIDELCDVIKEFRDNGCEDEFVIYTGYREEEVAGAINKLSSYKNIIVKFGRYIPNQEGRFDEVLGVNLVSDNQYAKVIS